LGIPTLVEYILIENQGEKVKEFIKNEFGDYSIIEHFNAFYRFKIETNIPTGKIFGAFEKNKINLKL
jgi:ATP-binding cassette subfamily A (ABC1) protein 3